MTPERHEVLEPTQPAPNPWIPTTTNLQLLLAYVTDLELEVDRLRRQSQFVQHEVRGTLRRIQALCTDKGEAAPRLADVGQATHQLAAVLRDLQEPLGYHPAHDQVIAIAVRPMAEQVFRWQKRLTGSPAMDLRLELDCEHVEWFPARLRHILVNLFSSALKSHDRSKATSWVRVGLRTSSDGYELTVSDNGIGMPPGEHRHGCELLYRAAPVRESGLTLGLAIAKLLVEQSSGTLSVESVLGQGSTSVAVLPRYDVDDYLQ